LEARNPVRRGPALRLPGFKPIPFEKIGLYQDEFRTQARF
jgi:hypothetical protein